MLLLSLIGRRLFRESLALSCNSCHRTMSFKIGCSVVTGLEKISCKEIKEVFTEESEVDITGGKVYFNLSCLSKVKKVTQLRSVEHVFSVVDVTRSEEMLGSADTVEKYLDQLPDQLDWSKAVEVWSSFYDSNYSTSDLQSKSVIPEDYEPQFTDGRKRKIPGVPAFRVTASRSGCQIANEKNTSNSQTHKFTSNDVAKWFGAAVNNKFGWQPNMKNYDIEVVIAVFETRVVVGLALTNEALHRRNISVFGHTTLNSTIAYGLIRLCDVKDGEIVMDPLSGTGAIPIECCSYKGNSIYALSSEMSHNAAEKSRSNQMDFPKLQNTSGGLQMDTCRCDATQLPFASSCVDVIISDLPFGVRVGSQKNNQSLYPKVLLECARILRPSSGRAAFLTKDKRNFIIALERQKDWWSVQKNLHINMGGMNVAIFVLNRKKAIFIEQQDETNSPNAETESVISTAFEKE